MKSTFSEEMTSKNGTDLINNKKFCPSLSSLQLINLDLLLM